MNWNEIKENYPKAWDKLDEWISYHQQLGYDFIYKAWVDEYQSHYNIFRDLYDFFDSQEIYVCIEYRYGTASLPRWYWMVKQDNAANEQDSSQTRTEAEEKAFECAFKILENKLPIK